jgi:hypothetical protein
MHNQAEEAGGFLLLAVRYKSVSVVKKIILRNALGPQAP